MALFKILRGPSTSLDDQNKVDGYCYFTPDTRMFYIDYTDGDNGLVRKPLNADDAMTLLGKGVIKELLDDPDNVPTAKAVFEYVTEAEAGLNNEIAKKMDKENPVGTGSFSLNRLDGSTVGEYSVAEGFNNTASGNGSHAEGTETTASGLVAHAEGYGSAASGDYSHVEGQGTLAFTKAQHIQGEFNKVDSRDETESVNVRGFYAHVVGNGYDNLNRSNAHTLDWDGNAWFAGDVYIGGQGQDEGSKKLATEDYVDDLGAQVIDIQDQTRDAFTDVYAEIGFNTDALDTKLPLAGGTMTGSVTFSNSNSEQATQPTLRWKTVGANSPYIGYATDQTDGTFVLGALKANGDYPLGNYKSGLAIGGGSGNLFWKGNQVATISDIPATPTLSDLGGVPAARTINSKALSSDIILSAVDVDALPVENPSFSGTLTNEEGAIVAISSGDSAVYISGGQISVYGDPFDVTINSDSIVFGQPAIETFVGKIRGLAAPTQSSDAANKEYVDDTVNSLTAADVGARADTWTPSASDIPNLSTNKLTSGTLPVARGGTGQTTMYPGVSTDAYRAIFGSETAITALESALVTGSVYLRYE